VVVDDVDVDKFVAEVRADDRGWGIERLTDRQIEGG
jgi:hypothetical protein